MLKLTSKSHLLYHHKFAPFCGLPCKLLLTTYLMDHQYNAMSQFLGENYTEHFPGATQDVLMGKHHQEINHQDLISPGIPLMRTLLLNSPTPRRLFKNGLLSPYEEGQSQDHERQDGQLTYPKKRIMNSVLNFDDESPKKVNYQNIQVRTAQSVKMSNRNLQLKEDKKNSKGLRNLSESVYKIVLERQITTYKQVADHLVKMLNQGQFGPLDEDSSKGKDQQNIKRRVYDALNVLISADVLKKRGKQVMSRQDAFGERVKSSSRYSKKQQKESLLEQIKKKQALLNQKKQKIKELDNKRQLLNAILKRNKKKKLLEKQKIIFPLIGITYGRHLPALKYESSRTEVIIPINESIELIGDMDLLVKAGIDILNQNIEEIMEDVNIEEIQKEQMAKRKGKSEALLPQKPKNTRVLYSL